MKKTTKNKKFTQRKSNKKIKHKQIAGNVWLINKKDGKQIFLPGYKEGNRYVLGENNGKKYNIKEANFLNEIFKSLWNLKPIIDHFTSKYDYSLPDLGLLYPQTKSYTIEYLDTWNNNQDIPPVDTLKFYSGPYNGAPSRLYYVFRDIIYADFLNNLGGVDNACNLRPYLIPPGLIGGGIFNFSNLETPTPMGIEDPAVLACEGARLNMKNRGYIPDNTQDLLTMNDAFDITMNNAHNFIVTYFIPFVESQTTRTHGHIVAQKVQESLNQINKWGTDLRNGDNFYRGWRLWSRIFTLGKWPDF